MEVAVEEGEGKPVRLTVLRELEEKELTVRLAESERGSEIETEGVKRG